MAETNIPKTPTAPHNYYTFTAPDGTVFGFKKPSREQLNLMAIKAKKAPVDAGINLSVNCVAPSQKVAWEAYCDEFDGAGIAVMDDLMERLGFPQRA
jgi:hypothetical protein